MKKGVVVFFVLEVLSLFIFVSVSATEINSCGNYSAGTYELNVSIDTSLDTCFTFGSGNFILDCQGNYVNNTSPYLFDDFVSFSGTNVTIKNCVIIGYGLQQNSGIQTFLVYNTTFINGGDIILDDVVNVFDNVSFYNDSGGNAFQFRKSLINNSLFVNLTRAFSATGGVGLKFYNTNFSNITTGNLFLNSGMIFDNVFFNNVSGSSTYYIGGNAISNIIITRSTFKDMESIYFFTGYSYNISISNSVFNNTDLKGLLNYSFIDNSSFDNNANAYGFSIDAFNTAMNNLTIRNFNETFEITGNNLTLFGFNFSYNYNLGAELLSINTNNSLFNNFSLLNTSLFLKGGNNTYNNFSVYSGGILSPKGLNDSSFLSGEILNGGKLQSNFDGSAIKNVNLSFKNFYCYNSTCLYLKYLDNSSINENIVNCTNTYAITIENSNYNRIYNNTILGSLSNGSLCYSGSHGILITNSSSENRGYNNSITNVSYGYLFEWNSNRNSFYDNYQYGSSVIFYDLHDNRNNEAYNNYIEGNVKILDNVSGESFYNNTVLGDIQFFGDGVLGDGTGATNITLKNMVVQGNIILQNYSTNIIFINVTYDSSNEFIDENSTLSRKWYLDASTNVAGTNINIVNYSGVSVYSGVVSSSIPQQTFLSYENVGGGEELIIRIIL
jgi:hypothetical protein